MRHPLVARWSGNIAAPPRPSLADQLRRDYRRFRRLDRAKQVILAGLLVAALVILAAAVLYAAAPGSDAAQPAGFTASAASAPNLVAPAVPPLTGQFVTTSVAAGPTLLDLHQFGDQITGTATSVRCAGASALTATQIVTGALVNTGTLSLTLSAANRPQSVTTIYSYTPNAVGFALATRDATGHASNAAYQLSSLASFTALAAAFCAGA